jgi:hypothetical protein
VTGIPKSEEKWVSGIPKSEEKWVSGIPEKWGKVGVWNPESAGREKWMSGILESGILESRRDEPNGLNARAQANGMMLREARYPPASR